MLALWAWPRVQLAEQLEGGCTTPSAIISH